MIEMFYAILFFGMCLSIVGFFRKQALVLLSSGIIFMACGAWLFKGVTYKTQSIITENATAMLIQDIYTTWNDTLITTPMAWLFIFFGFFIVMISVWSIFNGGKMEFSVAEESGEEHNK
jgi:hypothetical protein